MDNLKIIKCMVMELWYLLMEISILEIGLWINFMDKESLYQFYMIHMKENGISIKDMVKVFWLEKIKKNMKVNFKMINLMDLELSLYNLEVHILDNGKTI